MSPTTAVDPSGGASPPAAPLPPSVGAGPPPDHNESARRGRDDGDGDAYGAAATFIEVTPGAPHSAPPARSVAPRRGFASSNRYSILRMSTFASSVGSLRSTKDQDEETGGADEDVPHVDGSLQSTKDQDEETGGAGEDAPHVVDITFGPSESSGGGSAGSEDDSGPAPPFWNKRSCARMLLGLVCLNPVVLGILIVLLSGGRVAPPSTQPTHQPSLYPPKANPGAPNISASPSDGAIIAPSTPPPTILAYHPTSPSPSDTMPPSVERTDQPSLYPTYTGQPSFRPRTCFADREELKPAVDEYVAGGTRCSKENVCSVTKEYGWPIGSWCVSNVTDMTGLFYQHDTFNDDLSHWDTSRVTTMYAMFDGASAFNGDVSRWKTSSVEDMGGMFFRASSFDRDLSSWDVSRVVVMASMFNEASAFNGGVSAWNTSSVRDMALVFFEASSFGGDVSSWQTSRVTTMYAMFGKASEFGGDVSEWITSSVEDMTAMFSGASSFHSDLSSWNTSRVTAMRELFWRAPLFNADLTDWDTTRVTTMFGMFYGASAFGGDVSAWITSSVTEMGWMFYGASSFDADISSWNTSSVTSMWAMFSGASAFNADVSDWDTSLVEDMSGMFKNATLFNQSLCAWAENFPYDNTTEIFSGSGCLYQEVPQANQNGPFCASSCPFL